VQSDSTKFKKKHILIIEDNPDALMQVKTVLEKENYIVEMADSGKAALECLKLSIPDGIILDLMMPEMNGFEVLEKIRNVEQTKNIPVLILTAKDLSQAEIDFLSENTVEQFVQKGEIDIVGLLSKIGRMVMAEKAENELKDFTDSEKAVAKILIIDNNPDHRIAINAFLNNKFNIIEAENIDIGVAKAEKFKPDIVLLDISLQGSSGEEYIRNFKKNQVIKNIPIIAVTAQAMFGDKERFLTAGCDAYVSKPIDQNLLLKEIEQVLNRKKY
jgi:CheY-like chemotaxis protein